MRSSSEPILPNDRQQASPAFLEPPIVAPNILPGGKKAIPRAPPWTVVVEAVFVVTVIDAMKSDEMSGKAAFTELTEEFGTVFSRPAYASPTAIATGLLAGDACDYDQVLHLFAGTRTRFELILRVVGMPQHLIRLFAHQASILNGTVQKLCVLDVGTVEPKAIDSNTAFLITLPETLISKDYFTQTSDHGPIFPQRRIQIFDQERRLLFTKEWQVDIGMLNADAISWLSELHYQLPITVSRRAASKISQGPDPNENFYSCDFLPNSSQLRDDFATLPSALNKIIIDFGEEEEKQNGESINKDACAKESNLYYSIVREECRSRPDSISDSFVNLDGNLHKGNLLSRSDSAATLRSPLEESSFTTTQTVDMLQQLGFWLYGTRLGQIMTNSYDPRENTKTLYSKSPLWLLGTQFLNDDWGETSDYLSSSGEYPWRGVINIGPIRRLIVMEGTTAFLEGISEALQVEKGQYALREALLLSSIDPELIIAQLASWLELNKWTTEYQLVKVKNVKSTALAASLKRDDSGDQLELVIRVTLAADTPSSKASSNSPSTNDTFPDSSLYSERQYLIDCKIETPVTSALAARTVFVDVLSHMMTICAAAESRKNLTVQFVFLSSSNCSIEIGPQPNSLVQLQPSAREQSSGDDDYDEDEDDDDWRKVIPDQKAGMMKVLLWSEHIHDWISREISQNSTELNSPTLSSSSSLLLMRSPETSVEEMPLDLVHNKVYFFADSSLRFALSHSSSTWLCFRALSSDDFIRLLAWLPSLLRAGEILQSQTRQSIDGYLSPNNHPSVGHDAALPIFPLASSPSSASQVLPGTSGMEDFLQSFESCFWFTYRKDFPRLVPSILSSDAGFGCMIRAGQSMMAEALAQILYGRNRRLSTMLATAESIEHYKDILSLFLDVADEAAIFSVFQLTRAGMAVGTPIGQHFSPTVLARALRKQCRKRSDIPFEIHLVKQGVISISSLQSATSTKPQVVLVPLRLGADTLNPGYSTLIKTVLSIPQSLGIIGGRTARAFYIVGFQDDSLLYLDPHLLRPAVINFETILSSREYHTRAICELSIAQLDPTVLFGFLLTNPGEVTTLTRTLLSIPVSMPLFSIS